MWESRKDSEVEGSRTHTHALTKKAEKEECKKPSRNEARPEATHQECQSAFSSKLTD